MKFSCGAGRGEKIDVCMRNYVTFRGAVHRSAGARSVGRGGAGENVSNCLILRQAVRADGSFDPSHRVSVGGKGLC